MAGTQIGTISRRTGWWLLALLAVAIGLKSLTYATLDPSAAPDELRDNLLNHPIPFYIHVLLGPWALLIGFWQFLPATRRSRYHRYAGRTYVVLVLVAAIAGFVAAFTTEAGLATGAGFAILAVLWFGATLYG